MGNIIIILKLLNMKNYKTKSENKMISTIEDGLFPFGEMNQKN